MSIFLPSTLLYPISNNGISTIKALCSVRNPCATRNKLSRTLSDTVPSFTLMFLATGRVSVQVVVTNILIVVKTTAETQLTTPLNRLRRSCQTSLLTVKARVRFATLLAKAGKDPQTTPITPRLVTNQRLRSPVFLTGTYVSNVLVRSAPNGGNEGINIFIARLTLLILRGSGMGSAGPKSLKQ